MNYFINLSVSEFLELQKNIKIIKSLGPVDFETLDKDKKTLYSNIVENIEYLSDQLNDSKHFHKYIDTDTDTDDEN